MHGNVYDTPMPFLALPGSRAATLGWADEDLLPKSIGVG